MVVGWLGGLPDGEMVARLVVLLQLMFWTEMGVVPDGRRDRSAGGVSLSLFKVVDGGEVVCIWGRDLPWKGRTSLTEATGFVRDLVVLWRFGVP